MWVNIDTHPYMNDKYAKIGYMHAVVVIGETQDQYLIEDSFVVSPKPKKLRLSINKNIILEASANLDMPSWPNFGRIQIV